LTAAGAASMTTIGVDRPALPENAALPPPGSGEKVGRRPSILVPFLMSMFVVLVVAGVILWQAGMIPTGIIPPGLFAQIHETGQTGDNPVADHNIPSQDQLPAASGAQAAAQQTTPPETPPPPPVPVPAPVTSPVQAQVQAPAPAAAPAIAKPSPFEAPAQLQPTEVVRITAPRNQDVWVTTNPPGAKAALDDDLAQSCQTPCMLRGATGVHRLTISQAGYENESREVHIGDTAMDVPSISLRRPSGTLMLNTDPPGATVRINGKAVPEITPAQITLPPGAYTVTVEKGRHSQTQRIELKESPIYLRIPLGQ
jgi:hypothetical protein